MATTGYPPREPQAACPPQPSPPPAGGSARIAQIRRHRRLRRLRFLLACLLLVAFLTTYFSGALGAPLNRMGEWAETVKILLSPGKSFPLIHGVTQVKAVQPFSGGTAILGESELVLYAANGRELRRVPHGFDRASIITGGARVCIYNRGAKQLQVEGRTRTLYTETTTEPISLVTMAQNGMLALASKTKLVVYNTLYEPVWTWNNSENPIAMEFAPDNRHLAVACLYAQDGALGTRLQFFDTKSNQPGKQILVSDGMALQMRYLSRSRLLVVYDSFAAVYDLASGTQTVRYDYAGRVLQSASLQGDKHIALLFGMEGYTSLSTLVVLNEAMEETGTVTAQLRANSVTASADAVHVLADTVVYTYGMDGVAYGETALEAKPVALAEGRGELLVTAREIMRFHAPGRPQQDRKPQPAPAGSSAAASYATSAAPAPSTMPAA